MTRNIKNDVIWIAVAVFLIGCSSTNDQDSSGITKEKDRSSIAVDSGTDTTKDRNEERDVGTHADDDVGTETKTAANNSIDTDTGTDAGMNTKNDRNRVGEGETDTNEDGELPKTIPTAITLTNIGSTPIVIGNQCNGSFLSLYHNGEPLPFDRSCGCPCDGQVVCGCGLGCRITETLLVPGQKSTVEWDGLWMRYDEPDCYVLSGLQRDDTVTAKACWHDNVFYMFQVCENSNFTYSTDRDVVIEVMPHSAARTEANIILENKSGAPIRIVTDHCGTQQWFDLSLPGDNASLATFCPCSCDEQFGLGDCPVCGGCADDVFETIANDSSYSFTWDGIFWHTYESGCSASFAMPSGYTVKAEVCFIKANANTSTCQPVSFVHGQDTPVHVVVN